MGPGLNGRRALLRFLLRRGHLTPADLTRLDQVIETEAIAVPELLAREGLVSEADLAAVLADGLNLRRVDPDQLALDATVVGILKDALALQHEVLPVAADDRAIELAMANPLDLEAIKAVEFVTGKRVTPLVAPRRALCATIAVAYAPVAPVQRPRASETTPTAGPASEPPRAPAPALEAPPEPARRPARTFTALVVHDEPTLRQLVRLMLETATLGLTVRTAQDGEEALALAALERPDIVVLDRAMPGMDGDEVRRRLRADPTTGVVPILMLTAHDAPEPGESGADGYVVKPVRRDALVARARRMLEHTFGHDAVAAAPGTSPAERLG